MISFIAEAQLVVEELMVFMEVGSLDEIKKKLDKFYMVIDHVKDQILTGQEVPSVENLIIRLLCVPTFKSRNIQESIESSILIFTCGKGVCDTIGGRGDKGHP